MAGLTHGDQALHFWGIEANLWGLEMADFREAQASISRWWGGLTSGEQWFVRLGAAIIALSFLLPVAKQSTPTPLPRPEPARAAAPTPGPALTDVEVQAKWDAQMNDLSRSVDAVSQGASDAWERAKMELKRAWIEGQQSKDGR